MNIELRSQISDDTAVLYCKGKITADESGRTFRTKVTELLQQRPKVVVDLSLIQYIDSSGLGILVGLYSSARCTKSTLQYKNLVASVDYNRTSGAAGPSATLLEKRAS